MALIEIPQGWTNPRFKFGDRVRIQFPPIDPRATFTGIIIGMRYYSCDSMRRPTGWEYDVIADPSDTRIPEIEVGDEAWLTLLP